MTVAEIETAPARIEHLKRAIHLLTKQRDANADTIKELRAKVDELESGDDFCGCECGDLEGCFEREQAFEDRKRELAAIYTRMTDNPRDARERLADVLNKIDSSWRTYA